MINLFKDFEDLLTPLKEATVPDILDKMLSNDPLQLLF